MPALIYWFLFVLLLSFPLFAHSHNSDSEEKLGDSHKRTRDHIHEILERKMLSGKSKHEDTSSFGRKQVSQKKKEETLSLLRNIYHNKIRPVENIFHYADLKRHTLSDADIYASPIVLMVGPWSTGKSTIINYLLGIEDQIDALHVGAEPTTADFTVISYGDEYKTVEGVVLASDNRKPFSSMEKFGQTFLEHLLGIEMPIPVLKNLTFIDTPGILENRRQQERGYPYNDVLKWLVQRADLIFVVFDPTKLDVGTELESLFLQLKGKESVLRIILNKADSLSEQELMRVYGALFWSLAPLINVTEAPRIYVGSFWSKNYINPEIHELMLREEKSLLKDIRDVIENQVQNKIAFMRQQGIRVKIHSLLVDSYVEALRENQGFFGNGQSLSKEIVKNPEEYNIYKRVLSNPNISSYDLPNPKEYVEFFKINPLHHLKRGRDYCSWTQECPLDKLNYAISQELPALLQLFQTNADLSRQKNKRKGCDSSDKPCISESEWAQQSWQRAKMYRKPKTLDDNDQDTDFDTEEHEESLKKPKPAKKSVAKKKSKSKIIAEASSEPSKQQQQSKRAPTKKAPKEAKQRPAQRPKHVPSLQSVPEPPPSIEALTEADQKRICKFRKSCYETGILPDIQAEAQHRHHQAEPIQEQDNNDNNNEQEENVQLKCKYRKSCYETGIIPQNLQETISPTSPNKGKSSSEEEEEEDKDSFRHPEEMDELEKKLFCRYRKSCYSTGIPPSTQTLQQQTYQISSSLNEDENEGEDVEESLEKRKQSCKYRKSCYEKNTEVPQLHTSKEKEKERHKDKLIKKEGSFSAPDYYSKTKKESKNFPVVNEQKGKKKVLNEEAIESMDKDELHLKCKYRKNCYKTGEIPSLSAQPIISSTHPSNENKATDDDDGNDDTPESAEQLKLKCKYRKSCYETGIVPEDLNPPPIIQTETTQEETETDKTPSKLNCKYRKSCYTNVEENYHQDNHRENLKENLKEKDKKQHKHPPDTEKPKKQKPSPSPTTPTQEKEKAKMNKKIHKHGQIEAPEQKLMTDKLKTIESKKDKEGGETKRKPAAKDKKITTQKEKENKSKEEKDGQWKKGKLSAAEAQQKKISKPEPPHTKIVPKKAPVNTQTLPPEERTKETCKYRKDCYKSGKLPDLSAPVPTPTVQEAPKPPADPNLPLPEEERTKLACKYRKNCYETGIKPTDSLGSPTDAHNQPKKPVEKIDLEEDEESSIQLKCKYRKSCYETGILPDITYQEPVVAPSFWDFETSTAEPEEKTVQEKCKWRISCYDTGIIPEITPVQLSLKNIKSEPEASSHDVDEEVNLQLKCKYRKSCYQQNQDRDAHRSHKKQHKLGDDSSESDVDQDDDKDKDDADEDNDNKIEQDEEEKEQDDIKPHDSQEETELDDEQEEIEQPKLKYRVDMPHHNKTKTLKISTPVSEDEVIPEDLRQLKCKFRKSCYKTGVLPELTVETQAVVAEATLPSDDDDEASENSIQHKCKYRKSCYETGVVPDLTASPPIQLEKQLVEDIPKEPTFNDIQLRCKYRKSCYDNGAMPETVRKSHSKSSPPPEDAKEPKEKKNKFRNSFAEDAAKKSKKAGLEGPEVASKCNKWKISCRESLGLPPKNPKQPGQKEKKLCLKKNVDVKKLKANKEGMSQ